MLRQSFWTGLLVGILFVAGCPKGAKDQGEVCAYDADCAEYCAVGQQNMAPYCTGSCDSSGCPDGYFCLSAGQAGLVCVMGACTADEQCPKNYTCDLDDNVCAHDAVTCKDDKDCPAATACNQGACQLQCTSDDDCKEGTYCQHNTRCVDCDRDLHCADGLACREGNCNQACLEDADCRDGFACTDHACGVIIGGGPGAIGDGCDEHSECADYCRWGSCGRTCDGEGDTVSCGTGFTCHGDGNCVST